MADDRQMLELRDYVEILSRRRRSLLYPVMVLVLVALLATLALWGFGDESFESRAQYLLETPATADEGTAQAGVIDLSTQPFVLQSLPVAERVARQLGLSTDEDRLWALIERVDVSLAVEGAPVVTVSATARTPELAAALPPAFVDHYVTYQQERLEAALERREERLREELEALRSLYRDTRAELEEQLERRQAASIFDVTGIEPESIDTIEELLGLLLLNQREVAPEERGLEVVELENSLAELRSETRSIEERLADVQSAEPTFNTTTVSPPTQPSGETLISLAVAAVRNILLGAILGVVAGMALAFVREWQERPLVRRRDAEHVMGAPVLATVGASHRGLQNEDARVEDHRTLRAVIRSVLADAWTQGRPAALVVTTPEDRAVSLDVAAGAVGSFARAGTRVALVRIGDIEENQGVTLPERARAIHIDEKLSEGGDSDLRLRVEHLLGELDVDLVVIEAPPVLRSGYAAEIGSLTWGVLVVASWGRTNVDALDETRGILERAGCRVLGLVGYYDRDDRERRR